VGGGIGGAGGWLVWVWFVNGLGVSDLGEGGVREPKVAGFCFGVGGGI